VAVNPNNPTGSYLKHDEANALQDFCAERDLALISDEVFADYAFGEDLRRARTLAGESRALVFALGGLSKSCGLPQLKLGWLAVAGPPGPRKEALSRLEIVADTYLSVGTPIQRAAASLLTRLPELQQPISRRVTENFGTLRARLAGAPATLLPPEGGWSAVLQVPATFSEEDWVSALLERDGVLVHPGYFFDFPRGTFLVLSLLPDPAVFTAGVDRLVARVAGP